MERTPARWTAALAAAVGALGLGGCFDGPLFPCKRDCGPNVQISTDAWAGPRGLTVAPLLGEPVVVGVTTARDENGYTTYVHETVSVEGAGPIPASAITVRDDQGLAVAGTLTAPGQRWLEFTPAVAFQTGVTHSAQAFVNAAPGGYGALPWTFTPWAPASLDPAFGTGGAASVAGLRALALAVLPGGGVLLAAESATGFDRHPVLVRLDAQGRLDPAYGAGGRVDLPVGTWSGRPTTFVGEGVVALDVAGRTLAAFGWSSVEGKRWLVVRLDASGQLDPAFGAGGRVAGAFDERFDAVAALRPLASGGLLLGLNPQQAVAATILRLLPDGAPDPAFGEAGVLRPDFSVLVGLEPLAGGGLLALGRDDLCPGKLQRRDASGALDPTFRQPACLAHPGRSSALTLDGEGFILVAGVGPLDPFPTTVARYAPEGDLAGGFGSGGVAECGDQGAPGTIRVAADGRVLLVDVNPSGASHLAWLAADGTLDRAERLPDDLGYVARADRSALDAGGAALVIGDHHRGWDLDGPLARAFVLRLR